MAQKRLIKKKLKQLKAKEENTKDQASTPMASTDQSAHEPSSEVSTATQSPIQDLEERPLSEKLEAAPPPSEESQLALSEIPTASASIPSEVNSPTQGSVNLTEATQVGLAQKMSRPILEFSRKLREKIIAPRKATEAEEEFRKSLVGLSNRLKVTTEVIQQNSQSLHQLAGENEDVASLLEKLQDKRLLEIQERLIKGMEVFPEQAQDLVQTWSGLADHFKTLGLSLGVNFDDLIKSAQTLIKDQRIDITTRRKILDQIVAEGRVQELNPKLLESINKQISEGLNFSSEQVQQTDELLEALKVDASGRRIRGTLDDLSKKFDSMLFSQESLNDIMKTQSANGEKMLDSFLKKGLGAVGPEAKKGLFQLLLSYLGLNGLDDVVGALFDVASIGTGIKAFGGKAKGLLGKVFGAAEGKGASAVAAGVAKKGLFSRLFSRVAPTAGEVVPGVAGIAEKAAPAAKGLFTQVAERGTGVVGGAVTGLKNFAAPMLERVGLGGAKGTSSILGKLSGSAAEGIGGTLGGLSRGASRIASPVLGALGKTGKFLLKGAGGPLAGIITAGQKLYEGQGIGKAASGGIGSAAGTAIGGTLGSFLGPAGTFAGAVIGGIAGEWISDHIYDYFAKGGASKMLGQIQDLFSGTIAWIGKTSSSVIDSIKGGASTLFDGLKDLGSQVTKIASSVSKWAGDKIWAPLKQGFESLFGEDGLFSKAFSFIKKFTSGSSLVKFFESFGSSSQNIVGMGTQDQQANPGSSSSILNFVRGSANQLNPTSGLLGTAPQLALSGAGGQEIGHTSATPRTIYAEPTVVPSKMDTRSSDLMVEEASAERRSRAGLGSSSAHTTTVLPLPQAQQSGVNRVTTIDDTGLHLINHGMLE